MEKVETVTECKTRWTRELKRWLVGKKIVDCRYLDPAGVETLGFAQSCPVLVLEDGTLLFPVRDDEGNDAGALFGQSPDGDELGFPTIR